MFESTRTICIQNYTAKQEEIDFVRDSGKFEIAVNRDSGSRLYLEYQCWLAGGLNSAYYICIICVYACWTFMCHCKLFIMTMLMLMKIKEIKIHPYHTLSCIKNCKNECNIKKIKPGIQWQGKRFQGWKPNFHYGPSEVCQGRS